MNLFQKALNNPLLISSFFSIIARFTGVALNFTASIVITRMLNMSEAGVIFMLMLFVTGVSLISRIGVDQLIVKSVASIHDNDADQRTDILINSYKLLAITSFIFILIWFVASPWIRDAFFHNEIALNDLRLAGISLLFFNLITTNSFYLKGLKRSSSSVLVQNALPAISYLSLIALYLIYLIFVYLDSWTLETLIKRVDSHIVLNLYILSILIAGTLSIFVVLPYLSLKKYQATHPPSPLTIFKDSIPLAPISYSAFLMLWVDTLMVGYFLQTEQVALYNVAAKISFISLFFLGALDATIYPRLLSTFHHSREKLPSFFWQSTALVIATLLVVTLLMLVSAYWLLLVFGDQYVNAQITLIILLFAQFLRATSLTFSFMFIIRDKVRYLNAVLVLALAVDLICNILLVPRYGIEGAAIATLITNVFLSITIVILFLYQKLLSPTEQTEVA
ncbi:MAG: polysaccharide biosynthesis C-terminal domain-containing protein [Cocleimonas sp.]|nr:polysaccharide biosynthesis C-terminal domain-containing protein [Cocleimonas sp.]